MKQQGITTERVSSGHWPAFVIWALLGVVFGLSFLVFPAAGLLLVLIGGAMAATRPALRGSWFGAFAGIGAMLLYVAFVQRRGPGTVCWQTATAAGCDEYMNPWPWFGTGAAFVVASVAAQVRQARGQGGLSRRSP
jgi:hypothetical protein